MVDKDDQEKAEVGYQAAINLWGILVQTSWSRFNAMLVANSIIVGIIGLALTNEETTLYKVIIIFPFIGIVLCILWFLLMWRDSKDQNYYVRSARELEFKYLSPVQTVWRGGKFKGGEEIYINDNFDPKKFKIGWIRLFRTNHLSHVVIFLFLCVYILITIQTIKFILGENMNFDYMSDISNWITAIATSVIAITAIISSYYYYKLFKATIAKDKPLIRAYIQKFKHPSQLPLRLFVKNEEGGTARDVTLHVGGRIFGSFSRHNSKIQ
jgi:hypothetical protein